MIIQVAVLNLIINGLPSKLLFITFGCPSTNKVLNLIINGLPSKLKEKGVLLELP